MTLKNSNSALGIKSFETSNSDTGSSGSSSIEEDESGDSEDGSTGKRTSEEVKRTKDGLDRFKGSNGNDNDSKTSHIRKPKPIVTIDEIELVPFEPSSPNTRTIEKLNNVIDDLLDSTIKLSSSHHKARKRQLILVSHLQQLLQASIMCHLVQPLKRTNLIELRLERNVVKRLKSLSRYISYIYYYY